MPKFLVLSLIFSSPGMHEIGVFEGRNELALVATDFSTHVRLLPELPEANSLPVSLHRDKLFDFPITRALGVDPKELRLDGGFAGFRSGCLVTR